MAKRGDALAVREPAPPDPELLIREARERQRRRRRRWGAAIAVMLALGTAAYLISRGAGSSGTPPQSAKPRTAVAHPIVKPFVRPAALRGQGRLAFVSRGALWLLGSRAGSLRQLLPASDHPLAPVFSADGQWLQVGGGADDATVWLARSDGTQLTRLPAGTMAAAWSPQGHQLLVDAAGRGRRSTVEVLTPGAGSRVIARLDAYYWGAVWSPDGRSVAVSTNAFPGAAVIRTYPLAGGSATTWLSVPEHSKRIDGGNQTVFQLLGWWPGQGIGMFAYDDGAVHNLDQAPLFVIRSPGADPRRVASVPSGLSYVAVAPSPSGSLAVVEQTGTDGFGRLIWLHKHLALCRPDRACTQVRQPSRTVTLEPTWSPNGTRLAYVQAPRVNDDGFPPHVVRHWYAAHELIVLDAATGNARVLPHSSGAAAPHWSANGRALLYEANDALWIQRLGARRPIRVAGPIYPRKVWPAYYGQVSWDNHFAWSEAGGDIAPGPQ